MSGAAERKKASTTRILIADDQEDVRKALEEMIADEDSFELVGAAEDAEAAIALAQKHRPDVALIDVKMPAGGGVRAAREIGACSPRTKVVALSAYEDRANVFEMLRAGAVGYLVKGATAEEICETIRKCARGEAVLATEITVDVVREVADHLEGQFTLQEQQRHRVERVRRAASESGLRITFQPIVELGSRHPVGFEALSAFTEPGVTPAVVFEEASAAGLGEELELATLQAALAHLSRASGHWFLSVNVSPEVLLSPNVLEVLAAAPGERLVIEMTEHAPVRDYETLKHALLELRAGGARLAIDDAGAGFASLRHVVKLAPDILKIDGSIVREIEADRAARALTTALVAYAREMDQVVIAEGIERERTIYLLEALGVSYGQGYHLGRPGPLPSAAPLQRTAEPSRTDEAGAS